MTIFQFLSLEGHLNCVICSKVTAILVNGEVLPSGGVASGRVCACSLCSRLVLKTYNQNRIFWFYNVNLYVGLNIEEEIRSCKFKKKNFQG